jgi:hypothetical protein
MHKMICAFHRSCIPPEMDECGGPSSHEGKGARLGPCGDFGSISRGLSGLEGPYGINLKLV